MEAFLLKHQLTKYSTAFFELGVFIPEHLSDVDKDCMDDMQMSRPEQHRLVRAIAGLTHDPLGALQIDEAEDSAANTNVSEDSDSVEVLDSDDGVEILEEVVSEVQQNLPTLESFNIQNNAILSIEAFRNAAQSYAEARNFTVRLEKNRICCSRAGLPGGNYVAVTDIDGHVRVTLQKSKNSDYSSLYNQLQDQLGHKKGRKTWSVKCDCGWAVRFARMPENMIRVTRVVDVHTNGCIPSPSTYRSQKRMLGRVYTRDLILKGIEYFDANAPYHMYRALLQRNAGLNGIDYMAGTDAQSISNFKLRCKYYRERNAIVPAFISGEIDVTDDVYKGSLHAFWSDVLHHQFKDEGMALVDTLERLKIEMPGFAYRYAKNGFELSAVFWMFPEQRYDLLAWGRVMFVDGTHGTNYHDWPLFTPCVMNSDNHVRPIGYALVDSECGLAQSWFLEQILNIEPDFISVYDVFFTDDKLPASSITSVFPRGVVYLCWWHILFRDFEKADNLGRHPQLTSIIQFVKDHFVYGYNIQTVEIKWVEFQHLFPGRATEYVSTWMEKKHKWCAPWWSTRFTAMKTCNSMAEVNNSSLKVSFNIKVDSILKLLQATTARLIILPFVFVVVFVLVLV